MISVENCKDSTPKSQLEQKAIMTSHVIVCDSSQSMYVAAKEEFDKISPMKHEHLTRARRIHNRNLSTPLLSYPSQ
jgi:hypothetical protein